MSSKFFSSLRRGLGSFWFGVDFARRTFFNLLFLLVVLFIFISLSSGGVKPLAEKSALVVELRGRLVEQHAGTVRDALVASASGDKRRTVQLRDVLTVLDEAAKDKKIGSLVLLLDDFEGSSQAGLNEVGQALERFKSSGKPVVAWGGSYDQRQYRLASHANELYLHPMGAVLIEGFGRYRNYYRDALDKVGVTVNLMKVGTYKSFAEPFIGNGPSQEAAEADAFLYNALWSAYTTDVERNRKLPAGAIMNGINKMPEMLGERKGDLGKLALDLKLVDGLKSRDELDAIMTRKGAWDSDHKSFRKVDFDDYLARQRPKLLGDGVGVIVAEGEITDGHAGPGAIGGLSTAKLVRKAREDEHIKAVVLRVNSPGGSAYGSELIRRELELTRAAGKPVIVSMGGVAASGGYWISMAADEVIAEPTTITGSIGVFAILPTAEKVADKLGIHTAGTTTTWLSDAYNPLRPLDPRFGQLVQGAINHIYHDFTTKAAAARKTTAAKIDEVGQGRVWTGAQAKERGLVDRLGNFNDAVKSAATRARLEDGYRVSYIESDMSAFDRFLTMFGASAMQAVNIEVKLGMVPVALPQSAVGDVTRELGWLNDIASARRPFAAVTHCMCGER